jgi:hypothetical protein
MWYGEVAAKGKKSNSCPASNSGRTFATARRGRAEHGAGSKQVFSKRKVAAPLIQWTPVRRGAGVSFGDKSGACYRGDGKRGSQGAQLFMTLLACSINKRIAPKIIVRTKIIMAIR